MPVKTGYYELEKPDVGQSSDTWGDELNRSLDKIDTALRNCLITESPTAFDTPQTKQFTFIPLYLPDQAFVGPSPSDYNLAATQGWVEERILAQLDFFFPAGAIIIWNGNFSTPLPNGWAFCDGLGGRPNLLDRFIICAGPNIPPNQTGGKTTPYPGAHVHAQRATITPGPAGPPAAPIYDGQADYDGYTVLPYAAMMYIIKVGTWQ